MSRNGWENVGLAVLAAVVAAFAAWTVVRPYPGEPWTTPDGTATTAGRPLAVFLGDSYVAGAGASDPSRRWSALVAGQMRWREVNLGRAGTGYVNPSKPPNPQPLLGRVSDAVARRPDVVVVCAGGEDFRPRHSLAEIRAAVHRTYARLRRGLPQAQIISVGPLWTGRVTPAKVVRIERMVRAAAAEVEAQFVGAARWSEDLAVRVSEDGVHPGDAGHRMLAERVTAALV